MWNSTKSNSAHRASGENFYLEVSSKYVELLNAIPEYRDLATSQLLHMLPKKYRAHVPPDAKQDKMARAVIIGMLVTEAQVADYHTNKFLELSFVTEEK